MYTSVLDYAPKSTDHSRRGSRIVWPPPEQRFISRNPVLLQNYSGLEEDYIPMRGHGCHSCQDGVFD